MLPHTEQILDAVLDIMPELVVLLDPAGRIKLFNRACETVTGYSRQQALQQDLITFLVPEEWARIARAHFTAPLPEQRVAHEHPWLTKSGTQRLIAWHCTAVQIGADQAPHILGIGTDVTEQRRAEEKSRVQTRLLEQFFESTLTCAVLLDKDFNFIRVNRAYARACQREVSSFPGQNHFELYPSEAKAIFETVVQTRQPYVAESHPFEFPDHPEWGMTYWDWSVVPVLDDRDEVEMLLFCLNDVSQRELAKQELQNAMAQMRRLSRQLVEIQEQERRRIARELHDEIGQGLTVLKLALESTLSEQWNPNDSRLKDVLATANDLVQAVRRIAFDLRPPMLDDLGLLSALLWLFDMCRVQTGLVVRFRHRGLTARLPQEVETTVFRISQEALTNIIRHAGVHEADVAVWVAEDAVVLRVTDNGCGFDPDAVGKFGCGAGLLGMQERVALLGGELTIDTAVGNGTSITAELPHRFSEIR